MKVPEDKEPFSSDSEPESRAPTKSPQKREKRPSSPIDASTPKQDPREEKVLRRESTQLEQIQRKPSDLIEKTGPREDKSKK